MSIDSCSKCDSPVDTDFDMEFYGVDGDGWGKWQSLCENCREEYEALAEMLAEQVELCSVN